MTDLYMVAFILLDIVFLLHLSTHKGNSDFLREIFGRFILPAGALIMVALMFATFVPQVFSQQGEIVAYAQQVRAEGPTAINGVVIMIVVFGGLTVFILEFMRQLVKSPNEFRQPAKEHSPNAD